MFYCFQRIKPVYIKLKRKLKVLPVVTAMYPRTWVVQAVNGKVEKIIKYNHVYNYFESCEELVYIMVYKIIKGKNTKIDNSGSFKSYFFH